MNLDWHVGKVAKRLPHLKKPVLVAGLPGIGNVGKLAADALVDGLKAKKAYEFFSYAFPHSVFVNESNLVELPTISLYYATCPKGKHDLLILAGDVQPIDEYSCYEFSDTVLDLCLRLGLSQVVTLGGIGLPTLPREPKVFITGNSTELIDAYRKGTKADSNLFGIVGPIIGVSGLLVGLAGRRKVRAVAMLAETYGHPLYLGMRGSRQLLAVLNTKLSLGLDLSKFDSDIREMDQDMIRKGKDLGLAVQQGLSEGSLQSRRQQLSKETSYIG